MRFTLASASTFCRTSHVHVRITGIQMKIERRNTQHSIVIIGQRNADLSGSKLPKRFTQIKSIQDNIFLNFVITQKGKKSDNYPTFASFRFLLSPSPLFASSYSSFSLYLLFSLHSSYVSVSTPCLISYSHTSSFVLPTNLLSPLCSFLRHALFLLLLNHPLPQFLILPPFPSSSSLIPRHPHPNRGATLRRRPPSKASGSPRVPSGLRLPRARVSSPRSQAGLPQVPERRLPGRRPRGFGGKRRNGEDYAGCLMVMVLVMPIGTMRYFLGNI